MSAADDFLTRLLGQFAFLSARPSLDLPAVDCPQDQLLAFLRHLRDDRHFDMLMDVTAIDHYEESPRYEVVYHLFSSSNHRYLRVATPCAGDEEPHAHSITQLWSAADWHERETYDMFGIVFDGHPDLRRILMWDGYPFYPLRKEFPLAGHEVELPATDVAERTGVTAKPAPMMGGPFHASQRGAMSKREPRADDESWNEANEKDAAQALSEKPRELARRDD